MASNGIEMQPELMKSAVVRVMGEEEPIDISSDSVVAYHGQAALAMLAITFQGLRATLSKLSPSRAPERSAITVVSGHPGPGVREGGFRVNVSNATLKVTVFDSFYKNLILAVPVVFNNSPLFTQNQNVGDAEIQGV
jgi:hypothetical protein